ncbi:MAG: hypothetical protein INR71_11970 [Terriglobus roseus]|nr:hypothetical protein [Terriglobus roseus]
MQASTVENITSPCKGSEEMELGLTKAWLGQVQHVRISCLLNPLANGNRVHFPGAVNSSFTTKLKFTKAEGDNAMPTYRIMDHDGVIIDKESAEPNISDEDLIKLYKDMLTGKPH